MSRVQGFSLVELMLSLLLMTFVMGGVYSVLFQNQANFEAQQDDMSLRQGARVAMDLVSWELRIAGYRIENVPEVISQATSTSVQFATDQDDGSPSLPCDQAIEDAINGGAERITYTLNNGDLLRSVDCWDGTTWANEVNNQTLARNLVGEQTLFRYFDGDGAQIAPSGDPLTAAERDEIRSVMINLTMIDTSKTQVVGSSYTSFQMTNHVKLANLQ